LLSVRDLKVFYWTPSGPVRAVDGVSFFIQPGERFGLVGESGSGKSTMILAIMKLIQPPGSIEGGQVILGGLDLTALKEREMQKVRWAKVSYIPQGAMNSLNPVMKVKEQIKDAILAHEGSRAKSGLQRRIETLLEMVGLPRRVAELYPHELSGGMKQRVCIATAVALKPQLIIADEPTSALDVVVQRMIAQTLLDVREKIGASLLLIGHDMGLQAQMVDRLGVMYAGQLAEIATIEDVFADPLHPYTRLLISAVPSIKKREQPKGIPGLPPSLLNPPAGCRFYPRCPFAMDKCKVEAPRLQEVKPGRWVSCHLYG